MSRNRESSGLVLVKFNYSAGRNESSVPRLCIMQSASKSALTKTLNDMKPCNCTTETSSEIPQSNDFNKFV